MTDGGLLTAAATVLVAFGSLIVWLVRSWFAQASAREVALTQRVDMLEKINRENLQTLAESCRDALKENSAFVAELLKSIKSMPCPYFKSLSEGKTQP